MEDLSGNVPALLGSNLLIGAIVAPFKRLDAPAMAIARAA
jgi:hypothetical protein